MAPTTISDLLREAMVVVIKISGPMLVLSMIVGVVLAIFQAVTQVHEQTLGFLFKLTVVGSVLLIGGGWMLETLKGYCLEIFRIIAS